MKAAIRFSVVLERDEAPRVVEVPPALKKAMAGTKTARNKWKTLSYTHQKEIAMSIRDAKQEETRRRRLAKVMDVLTSDKKWLG